MRSLLKVLKWSAIGFVVLFFAVGLSLEYQRAYNPEAFAAWEAENEKRKAARASKVETKAETKVVAEKPAPRPAPTREEIVAEAMANPARKGLYNRDEVHNREVAIACTMFSQIEAGRRLYRSGLTSELHELGCVALPVLTVGLKYDSYRYYNKAVFEVRPKGGRTERIHLWVIEADFMNERDWSITQLCGGYSSSPEHLTCRDEISSGWTHVASTWGATE